MNLEELRAHWDAFARTDPLWSTLGEDGEPAPGGEHEPYFGAQSAAADHLIAFAVDNGVGMKRGQALDFGCRAGGLAQGLCRHFDRVIGIDLAPSHVDLANRFNRHGERCVFRIEGAAPLAAVEGERFDLICSSGLLLHSPPDLVRAFLSASLRALTPGGALLWQLPSERRIGGAVLERVSVATEPLPPEAWRAEITVADRMELPAGATVPVSVTVKNVSPVRWPSRGLESRFWIHLSNHWAAPDGSMLVWDGYRAALPVDLLPGESCVLEFPLDVPTEPGAYRLQFEMVQESVGWFSERGCRCATVDVQVHAAEESTSASTPAFAPHEVPRPRFPVHGVPRADVETCVADNGGHVVAVFEDYSAGEAWNGWLYLAARERPRVAARPGRDAPAVDASLKTQKLAQDVLGPLGRGIEIGASSRNPFPGVRTWNVDLFAAGVFRDAQDAVRGGAAAIDVVGIADALPWRDEAVGFVLASHVLEHMPDVLRALREWDRVVQPGGVVFMIVPHRERTFDRPRPRTPLEHLLADYATRMSIEKNALAPTSHYHVWITEDLVQVVEYLNDVGFLDWEIEAVEDRDSKSGNGFTLVARKRSRTVLPEPGPAGRVAFHQLTLRLPFRPSPSIVARRPRPHTLGHSLEHTVPGERLEVPLSVPRGVYDCVPVFGGFPPVAGEAFSVEVGEPVAPPVIASVTRSGDLLVFEGRHLTPTTWLECALGSDTFWMLPAFQEDRLVVSIHGTVLPPGQLSVTPVSSPPGGGRGPVYRLDLHDAPA